MASCAVCNRTHTKRRYRDLHCGWERFVYKQNRAKKQNTGSKAPGPIMKQRNLCELHCLHWDVQEGHF